MSKVKDWLDTTSFKHYVIEGSLADASFRKYFRLSSGAKTAILMDSSLEKGSLGPFVDVTARLSSAGVASPKIYEKNLDEDSLVC